MRASTIFATLLGGLAAAVSLPAAEAREWEVAVGSGAGFARSPSMDGVAESDAYPLADVGVAARVLPGMPILGDLWAQARFGLGSSSANDFQQFDARLLMTSWHAGAFTMRALTPRLRVIVRADLGVTVADLDLSVPGATTTPAVALSDQVVTASAYGGVGLDLTLGRIPFSSRPFTFALRAEVGWLAVPSMDFHAHPDHPDDDIARLPIAAAALGSIDPSGAQIHVGIVGRF